MCGRTILFVAIACLGFVKPLSAAPNFDSAGATHSRPAKLTVLFDAFGRNPDLRKDWGYAALIEIGGRRILFDTGNNPVVFAHNVKALGVDLTNLDFVVVSHRHGDHIAGLGYVLSVNPGVKIFAPKENFGVFGASLPATFFRRDATLPKDRRYFDGAPRDPMQFGQAWPGANIDLIETTTEIAPGIHLIALVSDKPGTVEMRELSLAIETPHGLVIVVGCSHPGVGRIAEAARQIDSRIHLIAGGLHLVTTSDQEIARELDRLATTYKVSWIAAGHCTGEPAFALLSRLFGERDLYAGVGATIGLGDNPRAEADAPIRHSRTVDDMRSYHATWRMTLLRFGRPAAAAAPSNAD